MISKLSKSPKSSRMENTYSYIYGGSMASSEGKIPPQEENSTCCAKCLETGENVPSNNHYGILTDQSFLNLRYPSSSKLLQTTKQSSNSMIQLKNDELYQFNA